jgi:hypothetical protein
MIPPTFTDEEIIRTVDNDPRATPMERDLADRLNKALEKLADWKKWYGGGTPRGSV